MATVEQAWAGVIAEIQTAMTAASLKPVLGVDWPNINILQAVATGASKPAISLFDRGGSKNNTKAMILNPCLPLNYGVTGSALAPGAMEIADGGTVVLTGSGTPLLNDAFFVAFTVWSDQFFAEYISLKTDTLTDSLTGLTAAINAMDGFSASLTGSNITVTNNSGQNLPVRAAVVNVGSYTQEIYRWDRDLQITLWAATPADRRTYGTVLENLLAGLEAAGGYAIILGDGSACRILLRDDYLCKDSQLQDLFRRDWIISADYPVLQVLPAWIIEALNLVYTAIE